MKCVACDQRKAKRFCPAKNGLICAQCCGEKRVFEIDCPESCGYLKSGREREMEDFYKHIPIQDADVRQFIADREDILAKVEYVLARERLADRSLTDRDAIQAVEVLLETYRTEDKGVLYEKTSDDLRIEALRRELRKTIESLRNPEGQEARGIVDPQATRLQLNEAIRCLEFIQSIAQAYLADRRSSSGYVNFLARLFPREGTRSSIVMP
jgi:hypothetical protein